MSREVTVTIIREYEIEVRVGLREGYGPTWTDPGEPDEAWIVEAYDEAGQAIVITEAEGDEAVQKAWKQGPPSEPEYEPDDEQHKPF